MALASVVRLTHIVWILLALVVLSACVNALPVTTLSKELGTSSKPVRSGYDKAEQHLRTHQKSKEDEDRGLFDVSIPVISKLAGNVSKKPKNEEEVLQLFVKMKLHYQETKLLEKPQFQEWVSAVTKGYKKNSEAAEMAITSTLVAQFGDEALAKMIAEAKAVSSTENIAARLEEALIKKWQSKNTTPDSLPRTLNLDEYGYISLWRPEMNSWVSYVKMTGEDPYKLLLATMRAHDGDDVVASLIGSAKRDVGGSTVPEKVEALLIKTWMPQSADDILKLLKLDTPSKDVFDYPSMGTWISYVMKLKGKQADEQMYKVLRAAYGDDELAVILAGSKKFLAGDVTNRLEEIQHKVSLTEGKDAKRVFTSLKLNTEGDTLFESSAFSSWADYVVRLSPENADNLMLSALKTSYDGDVLAKMLTAAKGSPSKKTIAEKLEQAQITDWVQSGKSADDVFKLLKLDDDVDSVLTNPLLGNWASFVEKLDENPYSISLTKLKTSKLTNTDEKLVEMVMKAKAKAATSAIAGKLEAAQLDKWMKEGKTAADVFKLLNLDDQGLYLLYRWNVRAWVAYVNKLDAKNADEIILSVLKLHYTDTKLATVVSTGREISEEMSAVFENIVLNKWLRERKSADDVFNFVLKEPHDQIFLSRDLNMWVSYVTKLEKENPYKTMWLVLQNRYNPKELDEMVYRAAKISRTKELGQRLIQEQWLSESLTAEAVFKQLKLNQAQLRLFKTPELTRWASYVAKLDPKNADEMMLSVLQPLYTKKELVKMIKAAKEVDETKELATRLEKQLLRSKGK